MAFGFFKKAQTADIIFHNGHIYTHDPEFPWAEAVACTDGKISAVGDFDAMEDIIGKDTEVVNLEGKYLFPGFIDVHRSPVMKVFKGKYLDLTECQDVEDVCGKVSDWCYEHDDEIIFGYGFREDIEPEQTQLDACCSDRPVVLLAASGIGCAVNTAAETIIQETAEEECVEVITAGYVLNLLVPFDFEEVEHDVAQALEDLSDKGITTVLNQQTPDYFENLYQDSMVALYNEGQLKQRFFGSYLMNRPLQPRGLIHTLMRRKTNCTEMGDMLHANTLNVYLDQKTCPMEFLQEAVNQILLDVSDKGFDFFIEASDREDLRKTYEALEAVRNKGYKNTITIASDCKLPAEDLQHLEHKDEVYKTWQTNVWAEHPTAGECRTVEEAIDEMTIKAAAIIGMDDKLGRVEKGRLADFAVFDENPLDKDLHTFSRMHAAMTVLAGEIVYDANQEFENEMFDILLTQHF